MRVIKVYDIYKNTYKEWIIPSREELLKNSKETWGSQFDKEEGEIVEGGLPYVFSQAELR